MQIKKDEIRENIIRIAEKEFLKRGFKNSSMRTIAAKAHTTIGNLYNYFENKEAILDEVIGDTPDKILHVLNEHESAQISLLMTKEEMEDNFEELVNTYMPRFFPFDLLLSNSMLILMEGCDGTKYEAYRNTFLDLFQAHIATHFNAPPDSFLARSISYGFLSTLLFIGKNKRSLDDGKQDLINYIKTMVLGMPMPKK